jgi:hypothetical protein
MISEYSLENISFIIPIKIDSNDRLENLSFICKYLRYKYINSQIIIVECDKISNLINISEELKVDYYFLNLERFSKTRAINLGLINSNKNFICVWDADMIVSPHAITKGIEILEKKAINLVIPHNQIYINIKNDLKSNFLLNFHLNIDKLHSVKKFIKSISNDKMDIYTCHGGVILTRKCTLESVGGFNLLMTSYGWEDTEILLRYKNLGLNYCFISDYSAIHLDHYRGEDSKINEFYQLNFMEYAKVKSLSYLQLYNYTNSTLKSNHFNKFNKLIKLNKISRFHKRLIFHKKHVIYYYKVFGFCYFINRFFKN